MDQTLERLRSDFGPDEVVWFRGQSKSQWPLRPFLARKPEGLIWVVAAVFGISGLSAMANDETEVGMFFGLVGNWKVSGNWTIFVAVIYLALSILAFWVPFFAE